MKIKLTRNIMNVHLFRANLEVSMKSPAPEILPFLLLAKENGGSLTQNLIIEKLLLGMSEQAGRNVIRILKDYGMLDENNYLTAEAESRISEYERTNEENVFKPESGVFDFHAADDPLLDSKIIDLARVPSKKGQNINLKNPCDFPPFLESMLNRTISLMLRDEEGVKIQEIRLVNKPLKVDDLSPTINLKATIVLDLNGTTEFNITGSYEWEAAIPEGITFSSTWNQLLDKNVKNWIKLQENQVFLVPFSSLTDPERLNFKKSMNFKNPMLEVYGKFNATTINDVPIYPISAADADLWALFLLDNKLKTDYVTEAGFKQHCKDIQNFFPSYKIHLPPLSKYLEEKYSQVLKSSNLATNYRITFPREYWHVQAPLDLI